MALANLAREAAGRLAENIAARGVEQVVSDDLPVVTGDRPRLVGVFHGLIDNAVKFIGRAEAPRVVIGARRQGEETVVYVRDNGIGIDPRYLEKVFGLFDTLNPGAGGNGVGLALVRRIVELHGGRVWVESAGPGSGSTFCFTLVGIRSGASVVRLQVIPSKSGDPS